VHAEPDAQRLGQLQALVLQLAVELRQRRDDLQPGLHRVLRRVWVRLREAEVGQDAVAQVLRDVPVQRVEDLSAELLVDEHHLAHVLRVQLLRHGRRVADVAKHHHDRAAEQGAGQQGQHKRE